MEKMISTEMVTAQNPNNNQSTKIDFTEFVKHLGREYGEGIYEAVETPEDLQCTIDWADTNFYESDSLNWMLGENSEYSEIASIFDEMEWDEYLGYERIFVDSAKERMEECLQEWKDNLANDLACEYQAKIDEVVENHRGSEVPADMDIETLEEVRYLYEEYLDSVGEIYGCECGVCDGFALDMSCLGDSFFCGTAKVGYDEMAWQYEHLSDRIVDLKYELDCEPYEVSR